MTGARRVRLPRACACGTMDCMEFAVDREARASGTLLGLRGELDIATAKVLREQVQEVLATPPQRLVIDLSATSFIDSSGCRELLNAAKSGSAAGVPTALVVPADNWRVRRVVDFMQLAEALPVHETSPLA